MNIIRRADRADLNEIHRMQDLPFRDRVFIEPLLSRQEFVQQTENNILEGLEHYYVQESEGSVVGFIRLLKRGEWEALTWGKWLNTLLYACGIVSFRQLHLPRVIFAVREDNRRVHHMYKKYDFRNVGQEFLCYRTSILSPIKTTNLTHYEITAEEFELKEEQMRKHSLPLSFR
jgi:hypothetical protein